ncbi:TRML2 protein, partial [Orthonyx spaldingii]|nr:TRML2 protein [Orthonyx spaldingii]
LQGQTLNAKRREGDSLYIQCSYAGRTYDSDTKYWCRWTGGACQESLQTYYDSRRQSRDGKTTIQDDTTRKVVSITMTDLKAEDSGTYACAYYSRGYIALMTISLDVFKALNSGLVLKPGKWFRESSEGTASSSENTFLILTVVLLILLVLALIASTTLAVRHSKLLGRTGNRAAEDTSDRPEGTAQPGSTGRRESSQNDNQGLAYINLDVQSHSSPEDPVYCNVEPSQAPRKPQSVEYAVIAFNQSPRNDWE